MECRISSERRVAFGLLGGGGIIEFYEFHDSDLMQIEHHAQKLVLKMDAYKHVWPDGYNVNSGTGWMQLIDLSIDDARNDFVDYVKAFSEKALSQIEKQ